MTKLFIVLAIPLGTACLIFGISYGLGYLLNDNIDPIVGAYIMESILVTMVVSIYIYNLIF